MYEHCIYYLRKRFNQLTKDRIPRLALFYKVTVTISKVLDSVAIVCNQAECTGWWNVRQPFGVEVFLHVEGVPFSDPV